MQNKVQEKYSLLLSSSEIGLGSLLHGLQIPLGGHLLSLNQAALLTMTGKESAGRLAASRNIFFVSLFGSALKILSPMGKKITPMLAILIQGLLFSGAVLFFGCNLLGIVVGTALLSLWGVLQSILFAVLFFGQTLIDSIQHFGLEHGSLLRAIIGLVFVKMIFAVLLSSYIWKEKKTFEVKYRTWILKHSSNVLKKHSLFKWVAPWFLLSLGLTVSYLVFVQKTEISSVLWYLVRPFSFALLSFYLARKLAPKLQRWIPQTVS